jgi:hypothetical protein
MGSKRWIAFAAVALGTIVGAVGIAAGAAHRTTGTTSITGGAVDQVRMVRSTTPFKTNGGTWKSIPGATTTITVPAGHTADILARFNGGFQCEADDGSPTGNCAVRILIGNAEGQPATGTSLAIGQVQGGNSPGLMTATVERSRGPVGPGAYKVVVQERTSSALIGVEFDSWHLTVERIGA